MPLNPKLPGTPPGKPRGRSFGKGNPGGPGRPKLTVKDPAEKKIAWDARLLARDKGVTAVEKLTQIMNGAVPKMNSLGEPMLSSDGKPVFERAPVAAQLYAACALLDRGYGRPPVSVTLTETVSIDETAAESAIEFITRKLDELAERRRPQLDLVANERGAANRP